MLENITPRKMYSSVNEDQVTKDKFVFVLLALLTGAIKHLQLLNFLKFFF